MIDRNMVDSELKLPKYDTMQKKLREGMVVGGQHQENKVNNARRLTWIPSVIVVAIHSSRLGKVVSTTPRCAYFCTRYGRYTCRDTSGARYWALFRRLNRHRGTAKYINMTPEC